MNRFFPYGHNFPKDPILKIIYVFASYRQMQGMSLKIKSSVSYLSMEIATSVLMEEITDTPCKYDTDLHMNQPNSHAVRETKILLQKYFTLIT